MKRMLSFVVAFVLLAGIVPAQAQGIWGIWSGSYRPSSWEGWYYYVQGDYVHMVQADQINWVAETMNIGRRAQMRYVADDLLWRNDYLGLNTPNGFYPLYRCGKGQRIVRAGATIAMTTIVGAILNGKKGAGYGAALGGAYAAYKDTECWGVRNNNVKTVGLDPNSDSDPGSGSKMVVQPPQTQQVPSGRENGWNQILRDQANRGGLLFGSYRGCLEQGLATLKNDGREVIRVYQNSSSYVDLLPRQSKCGDPHASYEAEVLTMVVDGYMGTMDTARTKPEGRPGLTLVWR